METNNKTYRAIRHDVVRERQAKNCASAHHPNEKIKQVVTILDNFNSEKPLSILDLFAGQGNLTKVYANYGQVIANEAKIKVYDILKENLKDYNVVKCNRVDSYIEVYRLISLKKKYDIIDIDPYGFPNRLYPHIYLLIDNGVMFVTMPKPYVNILNGITQAHLKSYFNEQNPNLETIVNRFILWGICHWRKVELIDSIDLKSVWRLAFRVEKVKATDYTGVRNR